MSYRKINSSLNNTERQIVLGKRRTKKNGRNRRRNKQHRRFMGADMNLSISPIKNKPRMTRCIRYLFDDTSSAAILYSDDLLKWCGFVTNASTSFYQLSQSVRLLRVGVTLLSNSSTGASTFAFQWLGTNSPTEQSIMYASQGVPARHSFYPPDDSLSQFWWDESSTNTPLCSIDAQYVTSEPVVYIDLEIEYVHASGAMSAVTISAASFTGIAYHKMFQDTCSPVGLDAVT